MGNTEIAFRTEDNTRGLDKEPSYSKLIVKAMKINTFYKGNRKRQRIELKQLVGRKRNGA